MMSSVTSILVSTLFWHTLVWGLGLGNEHAEDWKAFKRQDGDGEDIEAAAQLDPLRSAFSYASFYAAQSTATYTTVAIGASPTDASFVSYTTVRAGENAGGPPSEVAAVQGNTWEVDHIIELQFFVGAFSVQSRPSSIPTPAWTSASNAIFTKSSKNNPVSAQQTIASVIGSLDNLEGIPKRVNGFKQQVFTGRIKSNGNLPSNQTYPTDFGKALRKLLQDRQGNSFTVIGKIGDSLAEAAGNPSVQEVKKYFTSYAESVWTEAVSFLDTWTGIPYPRTSSSATSSSSASTAPVPATTTAPPAPSSFASTAPVPATTTAPPASPPAYATGTCSFHLTETENCNPDIGKNLFGYVKMYDNDKNVIGETIKDDQHPIGYPMNDGESYSFVSKLPDPLVITGEHANDYVQFTIGGLSWQSKAPNGGASCSVGGWDPRNGPICRLRFGNRNAVNNMDCSFPC